MFTLSPTATLIAAFLLVGCSLLYYAALPKPIPGIPCVPGSRHRIFGDLLPVIVHQKETGMVTSYLRDKCVENNEPIMQFFFRPFAQPWIAICDGREAQDIMTHRTREFDRSCVFGDLFRALVPHASVVMPSNDQWKYNRRLVSITMWPPFLATVAGPRVYEATNDLLQLWSEKVRLAGEHVFDIKYDIWMVTVDTMWLATDIATVKSQLHHLSKIGSLDLATDGTMLVKLPTCPPPAAYNALKKLFESSQIASESPLGAKAHAFALNTRRELREATKLRDKLISERMDAAFIKFTEPSSSTSNGIRSAVEIVVEREIAAAAKEGREPMHPSVRKYAHDELCFFLFAGSTTTAEVVGWACKYLTAYQDVQTKLRKSIEATFEEFVEGGTQPTAEAITRAKNPYLEAFLHETLRHGTNIANHVRTALVDADILGHRVPKGTEVFLVTRGPSFHSPAIRIDESKRSATSQASSKESIEKWNQPELDKYDPERWLRYSENSMKFDIKAAPMQTFGEGPRSCFGRSLAMLEMRIIYTLMIWNFEFLPIPPSLMDFKPLELLTLQPENVRVKLKQKSLRSLSN